MEQGTDQMNTGTTNKISLAPISGVSRTRIFSVATQAAVEVGHSRSRPAEFENTFCSQFVKPVMAKEKPMSVTTTLLPLEPAREPVSASNPG
jgi:hypothetical protein